METIMRHHINIAQIFSNVQPGYLLDSIANRRQEQNTNLVIPDGALTTDYGNSFRFVYDNRDIVRFCLELNMWCIWNGRYWEIDSCGRILRIGAETALKIRTEAGADVSTEIKMDLKEWSHQCQNPARVNAMLKFAAPEMAISWSTMDTDQYLFNVQNGTIDLRTGELSEHNPSHMNSKIAPVEYNPDAQCKRFLRFMASIFPDKPEMIHYMQKVLGYILTGDTSEKCFFIFYGPGGNNGKSVLINVIRHILGAHYSVQTPVSTLLTKKPGGNSNDIVRLKGSRFVAASELNPSSRYKFDEAQLKMLTGNDPVAARELFKEFIEYYPEFKLFIGTNHLPEFNTDDDALIDRVMTIPFRVSFTRDHPERDDNLLNELKNEASGILNWAVEGCRIWQLEGLGDVPDSVEVEHPTSVREATIDKFLEECCDFQEGSTQKCGVLYETYRTWCLAINIVQVGNAKFSKRLRNHYELNNDTIGSDGYHWFGITLKEGSQEP
jgi:putative DNA primase/helicase